MDVKVVGDEDVEGPMVGGRFSGAACFIQGVFVSHKVDASDGGLEVIERELFCPPVAVIEDVGFERLRHDWFGRRLSEWVCPLVFVV